LSETTARVPRAELDQGRPHDFAAATPKGSETADSGLKFVMAAGGSIRFWLRADQRLRLGLDFSRLKSTGRRIVAGCLIVNWLPSEATCRRARLGVVVGRKLGKATVRNRARRLLREVFRLHQWDLIRPVDLVLVARPSIVGKRYREVEADFLRALQQAGLLRPSAAASVVGSQQKEPTPRAQAVSDPSTSSAPASEERPEV
jgi:ribonuclease P protein component